MSWIFVCAYGCDKGSLLTEPQKGHVFSRIYQKRNLSQGIRTEIKTAQYIYEIVLVQQYSE